MSDLIRRSATAKDLREYAERKAKVNGIEYANGILAAACRIEQAIPAVDAVEVKRAFWRDGNTMQTCSACVYRGKRSYKYCPSCGARMDGRREDGDA